MRFWDNMSNDLAPYKVRNHGFGGSRSWELIHFVDKLVTQFKPKVVVTYCGSLDISCGEKPEPIIKRITSYMSY